MKHTPSQNTWKKHVEQWQRSGLSQNEYCRQHKLSKSAFSAQKTNFLKAGIVNSHDKHEQKTTITSPFIPISSKLVDQSISIEIDGIKIFFEQLPTPEWVGKFLGEVNATQS